MNQSASGAVQPWSVPPHEESHPHPFTPCGAEPRRRHQPPGTADGREPPGPRLAGGGRRDGVRPASSGLGTGLRRYPHAPSRCFRDGQGPLVGVCRSGGLGSFPRDHRRGHVPQHSPSGSPYGTAARRQRLPARPIPSEAVVKSAQVRRVLGIILVFLLMAVAGLALGRILAGEGYQSVFELFGPV